MRATSSKTAAAASAASAAASACGRPRRPNLLSRSQRWRRRPSLALRDRSHGRHECGASGEGQRDGDAPRRARSAPARRRRRRRRRRRTTLSIVVGRLSPPPPPQQFYGRYETFSRPTHGTSIPSNNDTVRRAVQSSPSPGRNLSYCRQK